MSTDESIGPADAGRADAVRVLVHALDQAADILDHVHESDLDRPTPCADWDVAALVDHIVAMPAHFVTMMQGERPSWEAPHVHRGWAGEFRNHEDDLVHHWHSVTSESPVPAELQIAEIAVHTWDLSTALGRPTGHLDPEVAATGQSFLRANLTADNRSPAFGAEQEAPEGADQYQALAAFAGRRVAAGVR